MYDEHVKGHKRSMGFLLPSHTQNSCKVAFTKTATEFPLQWIDGKCTKLQMIEKKDPSLVQWQGTKDVSFVKESVNKQELVYNAIRKGRKGSRRHFGQKWIILSKTWIELKNHHSTKRLFWCCSPPIHWFYSYSHTIPTYLEAFPKESFPLHSSINLTPIPALWWVSELQATIEMKDLLYSYHIRIFVWEWNARNQC